MEGSDTQGDGAPDGSDLLNAVALLGPPQRAVLAMLCDAYDETCALWRPHMVNLIAETGVGKTRVVRELYRWIAAKDPYWPARLEGLDLRKAVVPTRDRWHGKPDFYWLAVSCYADQQGPRPALDDLMRRQLLAHASALLVREYRTAASKKAVIKAATMIGSVIGVEATKTLIEMLGIASEFREIAATFLPPPSDDDFAVADEDLVQATMAVVDLLNREGRPLVFVLDDGQNADSTTLALVKCLLESARGVLVVATSWPTAVARQRQDGRGFGSWLEKVATTHRVGRWSSSSFRQRLLQTSPCGPSRVASTRVWTARRHCSWETAPTAIRSCSRIFWR